MKTIDLDNVGIGILRVSDCMIEEFLARKPADLQVLGRIGHVDPNTEIISLIILGPQIGHPVGDMQIPIADCRVTELEDKSLEWNFELEN